MFFFKQNTLVAASRMTMGQMWEQVLSKLVALMGLTGPRLGAPFTPTADLLHSLEFLHDYGFPKMGREQLYSGASGEPLDGLSFMGSVYYQRLRHMVVMQIFPLPRKNLPSTSSMPAPLAPSTNLCVLGEASGCVTPMSSANRRPCTARRSADR